MVYGMPCGCLVKVSGDTLSAEIDYCKKHQPGTLSVPAENLTALTAAADKLVQEATANMSRVAEAGIKLIDSIKDIKNPGD